MSLSAALRDAIRADGRSLNALGELSGVDSGQLSRFLRDERTLTLESVEKLIAALDLDCRITKRKNRRSK